MPEPGNPQDLNRYAYVRNNPLRHVDPSGHLPWPVLPIVGGIVVGGAVGLAVTPHVLPWDPPTMITDRVTEIAPITSSDMTGWLCNQMVVNGQSDIVEAIYENWTSGNPLKKDAAMQAWTALVGTGAIWDFKVDIRRTEWYERGVRDVVLGNRQFNYDAVANIHFGFVGRAAGFRGGFLVKAAGFAQLKRFLLDTQDPTDFGSPACYFDHPYATYFVRFGVYLYAQYGDELDQLNEDTFATELDEYIAEHGEPPDPPPGAGGH